MHSPKGKLVIIGGSVDKGSFTENTEDLKRNINFFERGILKRITNESAKKEASRFEIITASSIPEEVGQEYVKAYSQLNVTNVGVLNIKSREEANAPENLERLKNADTVMFTGGDQLRLTAIFGGTAFHQLLLDRYENDDFLISGTSAGAAASSNNMIYQGNSHEALFKGEVKITGGLGFINNVIIDTHFVQRGRIGRLLYACASNPMNLGIGLGEDAGLLIIHGKNMEAIGSGLIMLVDATHMNDTNISDVEMGQPVSVENLRVHVMAIGDHFDLKHKKLTIFHPKKVSS
ncbi:MAG TPA: cyanophycinase [Bacteroidia bacterium]|nr:cyanophycinase [Bacteroidia bacterium]